LSQFRGVGDCGGTGDELRIGAIEFRHAPEAPQHVCKVTAEHSTISVQLVEDDVTEVFKQADPSSVVRKDSSMEHIRIREHYMAPLSDRSSGVAGGVPVVREDSELIFKSLSQFVQLRKLILRQRFRREQIEGAYVGIFEDAV
jgi:hypothetical protein